MHIKTIPFAPWTWCKRNLSKGRKWLRCGSMRLSVNNVTAALQKHWIECIRLFANALTSVSLSISWIPCLGWILLILLPSPRNGVLNFSLVCHSIWPNLCVEDTVLILVIIILPMYLFRRHRHTWRKIYLKSHYCASVRIRKERFCLRGKQLEKKLIRCNQSHS